MKNKSMQICLFGIYNPEYSRNSVLISGFEQNGYTVFHCNANPVKNSGFKKFIALYAEYRKIKNNDFDFVIVATPGHSVVWLAHLLFGRRIIFDAFVSLYNSNIEDRRKYNKFSFHSLYYGFLDWFSCGLSDIVLLDTDSHINYFVKRYRIAKRKFITHYVGSNDSIVYPIKKEEEDVKFIVHFHGTNIPLQGIPIILQAAKILEQNKEVEFHIYGCVGQDKGNVKFFPRFAYSNISKILSRADIVLGIFGNTIKSKNVIPNKVFEGIAAGKPVITARTLAIRELFTDRVHMLLCENGNPADLADKIEVLVKDQNLQSILSKSGYEIFKNLLTPKILVKKLLDELDHKK